MGRAHSKGMNRLAVLLLPLVLTAALPPNSVPFPGLKKMQPQNVPDISEIRMGRTRCLANCPAYTVTIQKDGSFSYSGQHAVERMGEHSGQIEPGALKQVFRYIAEIGFMDLEPRYLSSFLDSATTTTTVVQGGERKTVMNYAGSGPATLWALEELIDDLLRGATWDAAGGAK